MANDRNRRESQDRSGDTPEIWEVTYIVMEYDVSEDEAREAINAVGNRGSDVDRYFKDKGRQRTGLGNQSGQQGGRGEESGGRQNMGGQQGGRMEGDTSTRETSGTQQSVGNTGTGGSNMGSSGQQSGRMEGDTSSIRETTGNQQSAGNTGTGGTQQSGSTESESNR